MDEKQTADKPEINLVSDHEFLVAWTESGGGEAAGRHHLEIAKRIGSSVGIGGRFYKPTPNVANPRVTFEPL